MSEREKAVRNERIKLTATFFNGAAIATLAIGGIAPLVSFASGVSNASFLAVFLISVLCVIVSGGTHV